ncbi:MAG: hypothetical protein AAGN82_30415, partial [Myxococcota bacterium]
MAIARGAPLGTRVSATRDGHRKVERWPPSEKQGPATPCASPAMTIACDAGIARASMFSRRRVRRARGEEAGGRLY